jgi:hypothetical protein
MDFCLIHDPVGSSVSRSNSDIVPKPTFNSSIYIYLSSVVSSLYGVLLQLKFVNGTTRPQLCPCRLCFEKILSTP